MPDAPKNVPDGDPRMDPVAANLTGPATPMVVEAAVAPLKSTPDPYGPLASTLLHGEVFEIVETVDGWSRGRARSDGYIGHVPSATLGPMTDEAATHTVAVPMTHLYAAPTIKSEPIGMFFLNARVRVEGEDGAFSRLASGLHIEKTHLALLADPAPDYVAVARMFLHAPYLWGGNTAQGIDCSGLVQMAMARAGRPVRRDSDMQEASIGEAVDPDGPLKRGDLVFWRGHVGILTAPDTILHATEYTLRVLEEPYPAMRARLASFDLEVTSVKRP